MLTMNGEIEALQGRNRGQPHGEHCQVSESRFLDAKADEHVKQVDKEAEIDCRVNDCGLTHKCTGTDMPVRSVGVQ